MTFKMLHKVESYLPLPKPRLTDFGMPAFIIYVLLIVLVAAIEDVCRKEIDS